MNTLVVILFTCVVFGEVYGLPRQKSVKGDGVVKELAKIFDESDIKEELKRFLDMKKRDKDEADVRETIDSFFTKACGDNNWVTDYLTQDVKFNTAGLGFNGRAEMQHDEQRMEDDGVGCTVQKYKIDKLQIQGDSAIALVTMIGEESVDDAHKGQVITEQGVDIKLQNQNEKDIVACELIRQPDDKWLFSALFFFQEEVEVKDK